MQRWGKDRWSAHVLCFSTVGPRDFVYKNKAGAAHLQHLGLGWRATELRAAEQTGRLTSTLQGDLAIYFLAPVPRPVAPPRSD